MSAVADLKKKIRRPEKSVPICLAGDLQVQFEQFERDLAKAREETAAGTLAGGSTARAVEIAKRIQALQEEMREHTEEFRFKGLTRREYSDLVAKHPPAEDAGDGSDVNWQTFGPALIAASCVSHPMSDDEAMELADDVLTDGQYGALLRAARSVNVLGMDVPSSYAASAVLQASRKSSK